MMMKPCTVLAAVAALCLTALPSANATSVSPMHLEMTSVGHAGRSQFTVTNTSSQPLPVETTIKRLEIDENGNNSQLPADEDFLIFPAQVIIPPGNAQVFRVQWVGEPNLAKSQSYMLAVAQIPLKMPKTKSAVQVVMAFGVVIDVAPPEGQPALKITQANIVADKQGKRHVRFTVENSSNVHGLLESTTVVLSSGNWTKAYSPGDISQGLGIGIIQPGKRRTFVLPDNLPENVASVRVRLELPRH